MRCPKCHYLSFDPEARCKNCGYDLEVADAELALRTADEFNDARPDLLLREPPPAAQPMMPQAPLTLELVHSARGADPAPARASMIAVAEVEEAHSEPELKDELADESEAVPEPIRTPARAPHTTTEMPLFVKAMAREEPRWPTPPTQPPPPRLPDPLLKMPSAPRPPLAVRRAAPEVPRSAARLERRVGPLDRDLLEDLQRVEKEEAAHTRADARAICDAHESLEAEDRVTLSQRMGAAAFDGLILGGIGTFVLWATLRLCDVTPWDLGVAALVPLAVFMGAVALAYLLMFTAAGGQTVGKMVMGIRVVDDDETSQHRLTLGQASWRAMLAMASVLSLGVGWIPALFGRGLPLHDRLAHTRVVRA